MSKRDTLEGLRSQIEALESHALTSASAISSKTKKARQKTAASECVSTMDEGAALKRIIAWASVSERSKRSVRERLAGEGFEEAVIEVALSRACDYGFIDDMRFASSLIRNRLGKQKGMAGIRRELASHDIDLDDVPGWPFEFIDDVDDEVERAVEYLDSHPTRSKNKREGAYRKLMQAGYSSSVATSAARTWFESIR